MTRRSWGALALLGVLALAGCSQNNAHEAFGAIFSPDGSIHYGGFVLTPDGEIRAADGELLAADSGVHTAAAPSGLVTGGGHYLLLDTYDVKFSFVANGDEQSAKGIFRQSLIFDGELIAFDGAVTCLAIDPLEGRAWIGGIILRNRTELADMQDGIFAPGRDVWFRLLDDGKGRTTFLGFEGGGGIDTSAQYCALQIWPDGNARTHPVTSGNITVH